MGALMSNPAFLGTVPALAASVVFCIFVVVLGKGAPRAIWLMAAIIVGFVAGFIAIENLPPAVPVTAKQKLFYAAAGLLIIGGLLDQRANRGRGLWVAQWLIPVVLLGWLTVRLWGRPDLRLVLETLVLIGATVFVLGRLRRRSVAGALGPGVQLLFAAVGVSVVSVIGASASLGMLSSSLAAATGGALLFVYGFHVIKDRVIDFGSIGWLAGGGVLMTIVAIAVLFTEDINRWALAVLLVVFLVDLIRVPVTAEGRWSRVLQPVVLGALALVPVVVAAALAVLLGDGGSPY